VKIEVGKKYTDGRDVVEIKFIDWEGSGWGLTDERKSCRYIKTYDTAWTEVIDKPDPGEGWRLLDADEDVESGDQYYLRFSDPFENWATVKRSDLKQTPGMYYRRRTSPQYVPYTWDDREELRDRWFKQKRDVPYERKVCNIEVEKSELFIDGWEAKEFLQKCVWLDGSPCGKKVV
jgi:hypothetical protein